ncbi:hypothetical protein [Roseibium aggregatum]|uniref:Uncharacterized protein n=1 Tax=Roseibium aggregatum TaxID=187304 RepID=A0A926P3G9_9HYPH|nr:hypothetical protein [Roseibium aggregatum]MBD1549556.1 hypothetical protein [Roseibium aggregatum]
MYRLVPLLTSVLSTDVGRAVRRAKRSAFVYALAGLLLVAAYASALVGGGLYLAASVGAVNAALLIAAVQVAVAAVLVAILAVTDRIERRRAKRQDRSRALATAAAVSALPTLMRSKGALTVSLIGGLALLAVLRGGSEEQNTQ